MSSASSLPATGATPAAITGRVDDTETHLLSLPSLAAGLIGLLRGRGATVMWVDTSDWPDCYATTVLLISFPHETTLPSTSPSTGTDERLWRWWNIDIEEELQWRAALNDERTTLLDDTLAHIEAPTAKRAPLVDYLTGTAWEWSLPMRSTVDATQMAALAYWTCSSPSPSPRQPWVRSPTPLTAPPPSPDTQPRQTVQTPDGLHTRPGGTRAAGHRSWLP